MPAEEVIVLASSKKLAGRCVAGVSTDSGRWVRPVSAVPGGLRKFHCEVDGRWPEPLDIVRFGLEKRCDDPAQPENVLIDDTPWEIVGELPREEAYGELLPHLAGGPELLGNRGAAVKEDIAAEGMEASLALIEPDGLKFQMSPKEETLGKWKPMVSFRLGGRTYELTLTDYLAKPRVLEVGCGTFTAGQLGLDGEHVLITVSLAEAHNGWHTKLAAAVLPIG